MNIKTISSFALLALLFAATACHEPEYIAPTADRQGLTSLTAIFTTGPYVDQELASYKIDNPDETDYVIPIPWYFPETSDDPTLLYMTRLRVRAELQPNYRIEPGLGILDLTEINRFTLYDPDGNSREITITGARRKSSLCSLVTFTITDLMVNGIINEDTHTLLIPYKEDLSSVKVSAQVSPHATLSKIGSRTWTENGRYNLNSGATVTVTADDGTEGVYTVEQGDPELIDYGFNTTSISQLFTIDPVSMLGLPAYTTLSYVSLAGNGNHMVVSVGDGTAPILVNKYTGAKEGTMTLGSATCDALTNDDKGNLLLCSYAEHEGTVNLYRTASAATAPELLQSFVNELDVPVGHRIKCLGDVYGDAAIVLTTEGITGVTTSSRAIVLKIEGGTVSSQEVVDFSSLGLSWGAAPVSIATVVPASPDPASDGYYLDYYDGNANAELATDDKADAYILHYISGKGQNTEVDYIGNWGMNPNCLDVRTFNNARYMTLLAVSHFPNWGFGPRLAMWDITSPGSPTRLFYNSSISWTQQGAYDGTVGAAGDVAICPSPDGFYLFVYFYDHHAQSIGAFMSDCIKH